MRSLRFLRPGLERAPRQLAALALVATLLTLDHPGLTIDEPLDVRPGRAYLETLAKEGLGFFRTETIDRVFRDNAEHPPLGRWLLGIASKLGETFEVLLAGGPDPTGLYVRSGRLAPAFCFAWLVWLVARESGRRQGVVGAYASGLALMAMPRVFAHAHLGALDLMIAAFWTDAYLRAERALDSPRPIRSLAWAGLSLGLALLTKIQAWLLPPFLLLGLIGRPDRPRRLVGLTVFGLVGLAVLFAGWPWLWHDPVGRLSRYLGTGVVRVPIQVRYFGRVYPDTLVPWHFPWLHFAATVPLGLQALGIWGAVRAWARRREDGSGLRSIGTILGFLLLFSTNVPVYDGERLYLMVFPLWALLIGGGMADLWERWTAWKPGRPLLAGFLALQFWGVVSIHPYGLSYYNLAVGGLPGAERLGLELCYWSESVDPPLLRRLVESAKSGEPCVLAPTLAPNQGRLMTSPPMLKRGLILEDQKGLPRADWLVVYRREAYFSPALAEAIRTGRFAQVQSRQGVWISGIVRLRKTTDSP